MGCAVEWLGDELRLTGIAVIERDGWSAARVGDGGEDLARAGAFAFDPDY